jgi:hypothetical protein
MEEQTSVDPIEARRAEIVQYDANIAMYHAIAAQLPDKWPAGLEQYRNPKNQHKALKDVPADKVQQVAELWYADDVKQAIKTETLERTKAAAILAALEAQAS